MTVPGTEPEHKPEIAETPKKPGNTANLGPPRVLTPEERDRGRATAHAIRKAQTQIEQAARKAVEALVIEHPEAVELEVGSLARIAATRIAVDLVAGTVPGSQLHYAAQAVRTLVEVARLEAGKVTSLTATVTAGASDLSAMLDSVRRDARSVLPPHPDKA